jgi:hypothetical protein
MIGYVVLPALVFAVVYFPIVTYLARGLASQYPKADLRRRFIAAAIDASLVMTGIGFYTATGSVPCLVVAAVYVVLRDALAGRSVGKFLTGIVVIHLETGRPAGVMASLRRNVIFLLPGANVVAVCFESFTSVRDPQGQRLGDRLAQTQVVEGLTAKEIARAFGDWWQAVLGAAARQPGRRRRHAA